MQSQATTGQIARSPLFNSHYVSTFSVSTSPLTASHWWIRRWPAGNTVGSFAAAGQL